jgi:osomolarity two-component system, response regulator SKN7
MAMMDINFMATRQVFLFLSVMTEAFVWILILKQKQAWEFVHPKFIRDRKDLLEDIKRKSPSNKVKKEETAAASQASISSAKQTEPITSTLSLDSLQEIRNIGLNLQSQIDQLKKSRSVMETNISQLKHKDTRIMAELIEFNETMTAKDNLIKDFLKLITEKEQRKYWVAIETLLISNLL